MEHLSAVDLNFSFSPIGHGTGQSASAQILNAEFHFIQITEAGGVIENGIKIERIT